MSELERDGRQEVGICEGPLCLTVKDAGKVAGRASHAVCKGPRRACIGRFQVGHGEERLGSAAAAAS